MRFRPFATSGLFFWHLMNFTSLRHRLLFSHLLLIGLMLLLLGGGIARFFHLGRSIDRVLDANVKSVLLMQRTKDALLELERTNGRNDRAANEALSAIREELGNITEPGEEELVTRLDRTFRGVPRREA